MGLNTVLLQLIAISLLDLSTLKVVPQRQVVSTTHALFCISINCLESENEVLQDYILGLSLQRQVQSIILGHSGPTSTFISGKSIDLWISGKLNDEIINEEISDINCLPTQWYLLIGKKRCSGVVTLVFNKEDVMSKPLYIPVNENKNHWILVIAFQKAKPVVSYDPLKTDFKRKALEINVFNKLL